MTPQQFVAAGCPLGWFGPVTAAMQEFGIDTPARQAAFLAQIGHESGGFVHVRELWGPTGAQRRYEGRADLGNVKPGDGYLFRGRGLIQITGRANYQAVGTALGVPLTTQPDALERRDLAARSAGWFWQSRNLNSLADAGDFVAITRRINGGLNGLDDRRKRWDRAKAALDIA